FNETLDEIRELKERTADTLEKFRLHPGFSSVFQASEKKDQLIELRKFVETADNYRQLKGLLSYNSDEFDLLWLENKIDAVKNLLAEAGIEWTATDDEVENRLSQTIQALRVKGSWWQSTSLWWGRSEFKDVWEMLRRNGLKDDQEGLKILTTKLENRLNLNHQYTLLDRKPWVNLPQKPFNF